MRKEVKKNSGRDLVITVKLAQFIARKSVVEAKRVDLVAGGIIEKKKKKRR